MIEATGKENRHATDSSYNDHFDPNLYCRVMWWVAVGAAVFLGFVMYVPVLRELFRLATLHAVDLVLCLVAGVASILWFEWLKRFRRQLMQQSIRG